MTTLDHDSINTSGYVQQTMALHLDQTKIKVEPSKKEAWNGCLKKMHPRDILTCFVPIKKNEKSVENPQCNIITLSTKDCSLFDVVNTLAYLRGDNQKPDENGGIWIPLHQKRYPNRPRIEIWGTNGEIKIKLHKDLLYKIQYGFACSVATNSKFSSYIKASPLLWIIRAWADEKEEVFRHGLKSFMNILSRRKDTSSFRYHEKNARLILELFKKMGKEVRRTNGFLSIRYPWMAPVYDGYEKEDNIFIRSIRAMLITPHEREHVYLSEEGKNSLDDIASLPDLIKSRLKHLRKTKHGDYVFDAFHSTYYEWFINTLDSGDPRLMKYLMYVYVRGSSAIACNSKKRKRPLKPSWRKWRTDNRLSEIYQTANRITNMTYGQTHDLPFDGRESFARFITCVQMRNFYKDAEWSVDDHCAHYAGETCTAAYFQLIHKSLRYEPLVQYQRRLKEKNTIAKMAFPLLCCPKKRSDKVMKIIGESVEQYFYNENSLLM